MFENILKFFKKGQKGKTDTTDSKSAAKERLHLVLMQDRANVSADFLDLMKQEIIEVIKKYIEVDESAIDVRLTNKENEDGTNGAPALYANIPILNIKNDARKINSKNKDIEKNSKKDNNNQEVKNEIIEENKEETKTENKKEDKEQNKTENKKENKEQNKTEKEDNKSKEKPLNDNKDEKEVKEKKENTTENK